VHDQTGKEKLGMQDVMSIKILLEDGTEIDDDDTLKCCSDGTVLRFVDSNEIDDDGTYDVKGNSNQSSDNEILPTIGKSFLNSLIGYTNMCLLASYI
jgi:hypothetical protein